MLSNMNSSIRSLMAAVAVVALAAFLSSCTPSPSQPAPQSGPPIPRTPRSQRATFRVAAIQFVSEFGKPRENVARLIPLITVLAAVTFWPPLTVWLPQFMTQAK